MEAKIYYALGSSDKGEQKKIKEAFEKIGFKNPVGNFDFDKDLHVYVVIALDNLFFYNHNRFPSTKRMGKGLRFDEQRN